MIYIGIDVHKVFLQIAAMDEEGRLILNERVPTDHSSVRKFFARFTTDKIRCVMESSSVWYGLYMYMTEELGIDVNRIHIKQKQLQHQRKRQTR